MKKLTILTTFILTGITIAMSQPCLPFGIVFSSQDEIDNFQTNFPGCTEIEGFVTISGNDITSLSGLSVISTIGGSLKIIGYTSLINLSGLDNLNSIDGSLIIGEWYSGNSALSSLSGLDNLESIGENLSICSNSSLTNLSGLNNLTYIGSNFNILGNDSLTSLSGMDSMTSIGGDITIYLSETLISLSGLDNLTSIEGELVIHSNAALNNFSGLDNLESIGEYLSIGSNSSLTSLSGLDNLTSIGDHLYIGNNIALYSLTGLGNLTSIGGYLSIPLNDALTSFSGLDNLISIGGDIDIWKNDTLTSLSGLENIDAASIESLSIHDNELLSDCDVEAICNYLSSPNGTVEIYNNAEGCNNPAHIASDCGFTLECLPYGNYYFFNQADLNNFQTYYPECTILEGFVQISGEDITNLNGLIDVTSIGGSLKIGDWNYDGNDMLTSLSGLDNLISIGGSLMIGDYYHGNIALTSLSGLYNLTSIGNYISIANNDSLSSLSGLMNLTSIGGELSIRSNTSLTNLYGLENVDTASIEGLNISYNNSLSTCEVQSICDYLLFPNGTVEIHGNAIGCNSEEEVEEACETVNIDENSMIIDHTIKPNPFSTSTTIEYELNQPETVTITFYDSYGRTVEQITQHQQQGLQKVVWTPEGLNDGIYYFRIATSRMNVGEQQTTGKVVLLR